MRTRTKAILAATLISCLILLGSLASLTWYVESGRLQTLIEDRAGEAVGASVSMDAIRLHFPSRIDIEGCTVSIPEADTLPVFSCSKLTIVTGIGKLMRKRIDSLVLVGARINLAEDSGGQMMVPDFSSTDKTAPSFSIGTIKIIDGEIALNASAIKADIKGILATLSESPLPASDDKVLVLNFDTVQAIIRPNGVEQIPVGCKVFQSKFVFRPMPSATEIEAEMATLVSAEIPYLRLPIDVPVNLSLATDYLSDKDSLENGIFSLSILPFTKVRIYGSMANLSSGTPDLNLNLTAEASEIATLLEYCELFQRPNYKEMEVKGQVRVSAEIGGNLENPEMSLRAKAIDGRFNWKGLVLEGLAAEMPVSFDAGGFSAGPGKIRGARAIVPIGKRSIAATSLDGLFSADASHVIAKDCSMQLEDIGKFSMNGSYEFDSALFQGHVQADDISVEQTLGFVSSTLQQIPENLASSGKLTLESDIEVKLATEMKDLNADYKISLKEGEFSSGEFITVAGIDADISGSVRMDAPGEIWQFDASGKAGDFEILIDIFYKDFSEILFPFSISGEYLLEGQHLQNVDASLDLGQMGRLSARGKAQLDPIPEYALELKADGIDLGEVFEQIGRELLPEVSPLFDEAEVSGLVSGDFSVHGDGDRQDIWGKIELKDGLLNLSQGAFRSDSISVNLPFEIYLPAGKKSRAAVRFVEEDYGRIAFDNVTVGPVDVPSLTMSVALKENALSVKDPAPIELFGGILNVGAIRGEELLGPSPRVTTSLSGEEIKLDKATEILGLPKIDGTLDAQFPRIDLSFDSITTDGMARVQAFGGTLDVTSANVYKPLSSVRTFAADLEFKNFDLLEVTDVLDFGSIRGVMEGTLKGLEVSQGQPEAFLADFETVKRRGVQQKINFDAVRNIAILGTGHGFQAGLGRGFATFFDEFGYDKIGFYCTLKNDNFRMQGKVVQGDTEYFVKGVRLGPSINVINRNPGQTVSFKSMIERINRIKTQESTQEQ